MKGTRGFSAFAIFVFIVAFSCVVRNGVHDRASKTENREFSEFSGGKDLKPLPFTGTSARIAVKAWLLSHPAVVPSVRFNDNGKSVDQTWSESTLSRVLAYVYIAKLALSEKSTKRVVRANFADDVDFAKCVHMTFRFWTALLSGFVFLFLMIITRRRRISLFGGVAHALMPAALFGTALELSPANFALPVIAAAFVFGVWHLKNPTWRKALLAGLALMVSVTIWSGAWTLFFFWGVAELVRIAAGGDSTRKRKELWLALNAGGLLGVVAIAQTGGFSFFDVLLAAPFVITGPAVLAAQWLPAKFAARGHPARIAVLLALFAMIWIAAANLADSHSYLSETRRLLALKIRFLNVKPSDPKLLTFAERTLWSSNERCTTFSAIFALFPVLPIFAIAASLAALAVGRIRSRFMKWLFLVDPAPVLALLTFIALLFCERSYPIVAFFAAVFAGSVLAFWSNKVRDLTFGEGATALCAFFGAFLLWVMVFSGVESTPSAVLKALFVLIPPLGALIATAAVLSWIIKILRKKSERVPFLGAFVVVLSVAVLAGEARSISNMAFARTRDPNSAALVRWMSKECVENVKFLCDPGLSPLIENYCGAVSLFPRIQQSNSKNLEYEQYLNAMFHGTEIDLAKFCAKHGVKYLIFDIRDSNSKSLYGVRYFASASNLEMKSPARLMGSVQKRAGLRCFFEITPPLPVSPARFIVFQVISRKNRSEALKWALDSERLTREGKRWMAARLAKSAVFADPNCVQADIMYRKLYGKAPKIRLRGY